MNTTPPENEVRRRVGIGRSARDRLREKETAYAEAKRLFEQFVKEGLEWGNRQHSLGLRLLVNNAANFKLLKAGGFLLHMRVNGAEEASALGMIMAASGVRDDFLQMAESNMGSKPSLRHSVAIDVEKFSPEQCTIALTKALQHIGCEPDRIDGVRR